MSVEASDPSDPDGLLGEVLASRYRIEQRLGEGAMGAVYRARHVKVGRPFAVKVLHAHLVIDSKVLQRFEREAELAGRLRHPNVIGVVDVGETNSGLRYMVMDFAEGPDLATLLAEAPMPPQRIVHIVRQLLEGLYHAHEQGLIHRDFKPENVIIERDSHGAEVPRIVDFGIAILREGGDSVGGPGRLTTNGLVLGTPHYMAPEQAVADPIDHRIDLFALGIIIYEMLSGKLPFDGTGAEVARANLLLDPPPISQRVPYLEVDPLLEAFARRLMAKKRDVRPPTAKAARELLDLIDRDRDAAAAALGVPLGSRPPMTTLDATPPLPPGDHEGTFPPPIRAQVETPPQAPPLRAPVAVAAGGRSQRAATTAPADPLPFGPRRGRAPLIAAAIAGAGVLGIAGVLLLHHGGNAATPGAAPSALLASASGAERATGPTVVPIAAGTAGSGAAGSAQAGSAQAGSAQAGSAQAGSAQAGSAQAGSAQAGSAETATEPPVTTEPTPTGHAHGAHRHHEHVTHREHHHDTSGTQHVETRPTNTKPAGTGPVETVAHPATPKPLDAGGLATLYQSVGAQLKAFENTKGAVAASGLWSRYRMIRITDAMSTQAKRDRAAAVLATIRRDIAAGK